MSNNYVYIAYQPGNNEEIRIQGTPELVGRFLRAFFGEDSLDLSNLGLADGTEAASWDMSGRVPQGVSDLVSFYRSVDLDDQQDQILVITFYYQEYEGFDALSLSDYENAYNLLQRVPVKPPSNMKSSVRNVVDRTRLPSKRNKRKVYLNHHRQRIRRGIDKRRAT